jgi:hypothetical protein
MDDDKFEKDREDILGAYRLAMKSGGKSFTLKFADGEYEIQGEEDIHRFIDMYKQRKMESRIKAICENIDKQYSH